MEFDMNELTESKTSNEKQKSTAWLIRCSQEQKDFFQKITSESGLNSADFIYSAVENFKIKSNLHENSSIHKELVESEYLIERLTSLIRSKILILSEKELQINAELEDYKLNKNTLEFEFEEKEQKLKEDFEKNNQLVVDDFSHKIKFLEEEKNKQNQYYLDLCNTLKEKNKSNEALLEQKTNETLIYQKQVSDSMKLYASVEERCGELKKSLEKFESENLELKKLIEKQSHYEKLIDQLNHKIDMLQMTSDQEIKRLNSEHELKLKIKEQEIYNKVTQVQPQLKSES